MKRSFHALLLPLLASAGAASAAPTVVTYSPGLAIPDNSTVGVADMRMVVSDIIEIYTLEVSVTLTGGFNGDYFMYLEHDDGYSVLLNRPGLTTTDDLGYADSGVAVTFTSGATNGDIHKYGLLTNPGGGQLTGIWQPDGRAVNPLVAYDTAPRTALLDSFQGENANGLWTLYVADRSSGFTGTLTNWSLTITGATVPEPGVAALVLGYYLLTLLTGRRRPL